MDLLYGLWFGFWNGLDDMFYGLEKMQIAEMKIFNFSCSFLFYFFCAKGLNFFYKNSIYDYMYVKRSPLHLSDKFIFVNRNLDTRFLNWCMLSTSKN